MFMNIRLLWILVAGLACVLPACEKSSTTDTAGTEEQARCAHEIKQAQCPFCNPKLIETDGFCGEHGVAEALCATCRPYLRAAFRAKGDWCDEHKTPESQCIACNPELEANRMPGVHGGQIPSNGLAEPMQESCEHGIAETKCPFCTPALIESDGFCQGHDVAEALCVKCRPYLETAFKAEGDWCAGHDTPESQCTICNPELLNEDDGNGG